MSEDQLEDGVQDNQRSIVIGAVLLALLIAAVLWYTLIFRGGEEQTQELAQINEEEQMGELPADPQFSEEEIAQDEFISDSMVPYTDPAFEGNPVEVEPVTTDPDLAESSPTVEGTTETSPVPAPVTSETGASTFLAAAAAAASLGGLFGLQRIRRQ